MKRKLDDVSKKLELLYDRLRDNSVSLCTAFWYGIFDWKSTFSLKCAVMLCPMFWCFAQSNWHVCVFVTAVIFGDPGPTSDCTIRATVWLQYRPPNLHTDGQSRELLRNQQLYAWTQNVNTISNANECVCTSTLAPC